jgi:hypothetical protein
MEASKAVDAMYRSKAPGATSAFTGMYPLREYAHPARNRPTTPTKIPATNFPILLPLLN